jgi:hypothetical protein
MYHNTVNGVGNFAGIFSAIGSFAQTGFGKFIMGLAEAGAKIGITYGITSAFAPKPAQTSTQTTPIVSGSSSNVALPVAVQVNQQATNSDLISQTNQTGQIGQTDEISQTVKQLLVPATIIAVLFVMITKET